MTARRRSGWRSNNGSSPEGRPTDSPYTLLHEAVFDVLDGDLAGAHATAHTMVRDMTALAMPEVERIRHNDPTDDRSRTGDA